MKDRNILYKGKASFAKVGELGTTIGTLVGIRVMLFAFFDLQPAIALALNYLLGAICLIAVLIILFYRDQESLEIAKDNGKLVFKHFKNKKLVHEFTPINFSFWWKYHYGNYTGSGRLPEDVGSNSSLEGSGPMNNFHLHIEMENEKGEILALYDLQPFFIEFPHGWSYSINNISKDAYIIEDQNNKKIVKILKEYLEEKKIAGAVSF